jgi:hypothetical protein
LNVKLARVPFLVLLSRLVGPLVVGPLNNPSSFAFAAALPTFPSEAASLRSCAQIAAEMGCFAHCFDAGRSAVIGKIHRLKLPVPSTKNSKNANRLLYSNLTSAPETAPSASRIRQKQNVSRAGVKAKAK